MLNWSWIATGHDLAKRRATRLWVVSKTRWRQTLTHHLAKDMSSEVEYACVGEFLQVLSNRHPFLVQSSDRQGFPQTNNKLERSTRTLKPWIGGARRGTALCCAMWRRRPGGNRIRLIKSCSSSESLAWIAPAFEMRQATRAAHSERLTHFRSRYKRQ
jgi:hypothetical protein